jgi:hypothetical protein
MFERFTERARQAVVVSEMTRVVEPAPARRDWLPPLVAGLFLAVGLAVGVLLGWAIWG